MLTNAQQEAPNALSGVVIGAAIEVHRSPSNHGPGIIGISVYEECLVLELTLRGVAAERQVQTPLKYKEHGLRTMLRTDLVVQDSLLVEVKSVDKLAAIHDSQVLTYLKLTGLPVGLLLNFNETLLKNGIKPLANGF
jgi:GxxExxY protein